ncbi:hypothetical protein [Microtetraspora sp. NBRC 13810]|uniref:hypothetical protein n=1 Tax=Microtetraspora sp. NBRC 13810 TaxID=3030990 RepID=UPI002555B40D|nr:hypothetical protein [Microtetraspora sp. NBRC 13810]
MTNRARIFTMAALTGAGLFAATAPAVAAPQDPPPNVLEGEGMLPEGVFYAIWHNALQQQQRGF